MPTFSDHQEYLDRLIINHEKRLAEALQELERRLSAFAMSAPVNDDELFDLEWAQAARNDIRQMIDETYLAEIQKQIEEYPEMSAEALSVLNSYSDFTGVDAATVVALQRLNFSGFEAIAVQQLDVISKEIYQYTLTGGSRAEMIERLRQSINGVYMQSDQVEIQALVIKAQSSNPVVAKKAIDTLHSVYAADKLGRNMRRYGTQMIHDSLMQYNRTIVSKMASEAGYEEYEYQGPEPIETTRPHCRKYIDKVNTLEKWKEIWQANWTGKSGSEPLVNAGGYNCRHVFYPHIEG
jgi:hypothetical protein